MVPKFMRPTAILKIRDKEVQRIKDDPTRITKLQEILRKHREYLRNERYIFMNTKSLIFRKEEKRKIVNIQDDKNKSNAIIT